MACFFQGMTDIVQIFIHQVKKGEQNDSLDKGTGSETCTGGSGD